jgi:hypothetical protein
MLPNYSGAGLVNLIASIVQACGGKPRHPVLAALPAAQLAAARNIVLVIIDGLGDNYLARRGAGGELARRRRAAITSVFPSTTASAITTSYTGCTPLEHGITGWFTFFGEAGCVAAALQFRSRGDMRPLQERGLHPRNAFAVDPIFPGMPVRSIVVTSKQIIDSDYNLRHCAGAERLAYETLEQFISQVESAVKSGAERKFVYAYWPHYDVISHRHGSQSRQAAEELERVDRAFGTLLQRLSGTESLVIATADHGFIDVAPEQSFELPAALCAMLRFPLCGERRIAYCHVHSAESFLQKANDWLGERADVRFSRELVEGGWFGPGTAHPRFTERIGDVALIMRGHNTVKDWTPGEPRHLHIGNHGGTSEDEMMIPLVTEET